MTKTDNAIAVNYLYMDSICTSQSSLQYMSSKHLRSQSKNSIEYNLSTQNMFGTKRGPTHVPLPPKKMTKHLLFFPLASGSRQISS